jgi:L-2-hydroxyglutarate oxidase LhgO
MSITIIQTDAVLIGCGIMSATLGVMLKELDPKLKIHIVERLDEIAGESSDAWNNAGTGHAALCELNYTPENADGSINISKALKVDEEFEMSKQFWAWLARQKRIQPANFIHSIPHMSFVAGPSDVEFLRKRHAAMNAHPLFHGMEFTTDRKQIGEWAPLLMKDRTDTEAYAATRSMLGTDVNFGELTRMLFKDLDTLTDTDIHLSHDVRDLERMDNGQWRVEVRDLKSGEKKEYHARFVFIGAGGGALPLLEKSDIPEAEGYGGFPVSGQWLRCLDPKIIQQHHAKVYGKAKSGSPPMSVPHLDTRTIGTEQALLFGPIRGVQHQIPQARQLAGPAVLIGMGQHYAHGTSWMEEHGPHQIPHRAGKSYTGRALGRVERVHAHGGTKGLGTGHCRATCAGHQKGPEGRRRAGVRHRAGFRCRWQLGRVVGRISGGQHGSFHHAETGVEMLPGARCRMAGWPEKHGAFAWPDPRG